LAFAALSADYLNLLKNAKPFGSVSNVSLLERAVSSIGQTNYVDGSGDAGWLRLRDSEISGSVPSGASQDMTVREYAAFAILTGLARGGITSAVTTGSAVILLPSFYTDQAAWDRTLVHETLHAATGFSDTGLAGLLGINTTGMSQEQASEAIDALFKRNCSKQ
jgi:hypothetical protein